MSKAAKGKSGDEKVAKKGAATDPAPDDAPAFGDALAELEAILKRIESDEVDIDELGEELKRATHLLELCRGKIRRAEVEVNQILEDI